MAGCQEAFRRSTVVAVALCLGAHGLSACDSGGGSGGVILTYYWIPLESDFTCPQRDTLLGTCDGAVIATVCLAFAESARMEGTATLETGELVNLDCDCGAGFSCFARLDEALFPWGMGSEGNALELYVSVATNDPRWPFGTLLRVKELEGLALPGSSLEHNGCVRVDDVGWSFGVNQLDLFVGREASYQAIDAQLGIDEATVTEEPSCPLQEYRP